MTKKLTEEEANCGKIGDLDVYRLKTIKDLLV